MEVRSLNFVQPEYGKPIRNVPSWGLRYDLSEVDRLLESLEAGEWLPVTLPDVAKATGYQGACLKRKIYNVIRRKNTVYLQLVSANGVVPPINPASVHHKGGRPKKVK